MTLRSRSRPAELPTSAQRSAGLILAVTTPAFVLLAWALIPWQSVPGGPLPQLSASSVFTAAELATADHYSWWARVWSWSSLALSLLVAVLVAVLVSGRKVWGSLLTHLRGPHWLRVLALVVLFVGAQRFATLPCSVALRQLRLSVGLTTQSWLGWARDLLVTDAISVVTSGLALLALLWLRQRLPQRWPIAAAGGAAGLVILGSFLWPVAIEPLFNRFEPARDPGLHSRVMELARRQGVAIDGILVADASRRTTALNAYVSGIGGSRRVVVYDTLVGNGADQVGLPPAQVDAVIAHELSHARHHDVVVGTLLGAVGAAIAIGCLGLLLPRPGDRHTELRLVPLVLALSLWGTTLSAPVTNAISRAVETRADVDALRATQDGASFIAMQRQLALRSLADPTPPGWSYWWFGSHPGVLTRIAIAERVTEKAPTREGTGKG